MGDDDGGAPAPADALSEWEDAGEEIASNGDVPVADEETATGGSDGGDPLPVRLGKALLSTEPDESPGDYPDLSDVTADLLIGTKKVLNDLTGTAVDKGTPAIVNFGRALSAAGGDDEDDDGEQLAEDATGVEVGRGDGA